VAALSADPWAVAAADRVLHELSVLKDWLEERGLKHTLEDLATLVVKHRDPTDTEAPLADLLMATLAKHLLWSEGNENRKLEVVVTRVRFQALRRWMYEAENIGAGRVMGRREMDSPDLRVRTGLERFSDTLGRVTDSAYEIHGVRYTLTKEWKTETRDWCVFLAADHPVHVEPWP
jgi:hypothetical protein